MGRPSWLRKAPHQLTHTHGPYEPSGKITHSLPEEMDANVAEMLFYFAVNRARQPLSSPYIPWLESDTLIPPPAEEIHTQLSK